MERREDAAECKIKKTLKKLSSTMDCKCAPRLDDFDYANTKHKYLLRKYPSLSPALEGELAIGEEELRSL